MPAPFNHPKPRNMTQPEAIVAAPSAIDAEEFVTREGDYMTAVPVAFRITGQTAEPIYYPSIPSGWQQIEISPMRTRSAWGQSAATGPALADLLKRANQ